MLLLQEEENDYEEGESDYSDSETPTAFRKPNRGNKNWHKALAKDLVENFSRTATATSKSKPAVKKGSSKAASSNKQTSAAPTNSTSSDQQQQLPPAPAGQPRLVRRHSITLCQSRARKYTPPSSGPTGQTGPTASGPKSMAERRV